MKVISLNISRPKEIEWHGKTITTGIFKEPVLDRLTIKGVNITGDDQADRSVHGGQDKAIYAYPFEHYPYFENLYPNLKFSYGMFGENLTTNGLLEDQVNVGDIFRIGTTEIIAVQPRQPCYKLGIKFGSQSIVKVFARTPYSGIYFKIRKEGAIGPEDRIELIKRDTGNVSIVDVLDILNGKTDLDILQRASELEHLPFNIKFRILEFLTQ